MLQMTPKTDFVKELNAAKCFSLQNLPVLNADLEWLYTELQQFKLAGSSIPNTKDSVTNTAADLFSK